MLKEITKDSRPTDPAGIARLRDSIARRLLGLAIAFGFGIPLGVMSASFSDPALNLLLQKGIVTEEEAQKAQAEADALRTNQVYQMQPAESKWVIGKAIKHVELFGDLRFRYEDRSVEDPAGGSIDLQRLRYSMRLGLRGDVLDDFYFGFRLDPSSNPRSPWLTLGSSTGGTPYQGPFGKSTASLNIGQAYLGWKGFNWLDVTVGKMPNPLYTTSMVWDPDLNPEGLTERFKHTIGPVDLFATFGQYIYQDTNPTHASSGFFNIAYKDANLPFLLAWQAGANYHIDKNISLKAAPALYNYTGYGKSPTLNPPQGTPGFDGDFVGQGSTNGIGGQPGAWSGFPNGGYDGFIANQTGIKNLLIVEVPAELNLRLDRMDARIFGDYAWNLRGADRARAAYNGVQNAIDTGLGFPAPISSPQTRDTKAYQIGFAIGSTNSLGLVTGANARKNAWEARAYWQHAEQYSLDPNLIDSDFFEGRLNMEGVYTAFAYSFNESVIATFRYGYARRINNKLGTGGSNQDIPQMNPIEHYNLFQVDLTFRF